MVFSEPVQLGAVALGTTSTVPRRRVTRVVVLALVATCLLVAAAWSTSSLSESEAYRVSLDDEVDNDLAEDPFSDYEKDARQQTESEHSALAVTRKGSFRKVKHELGRLMAEKVGKEPVKQEMIQEFKARDLMREISEAMDDTTSPKMSLQEQIKANAKLSSAKSRAAQKLQDKVGHLSRVAAGAEARAAPLLRRAARLYHEQEDYRGDAADAESDGKEKMATGRELMKKAIRVRARLLREEKPIEDAQNKAHGLDIEYRHDALAYANDMVRAEHLRKSPALAKKYQAKLAAMRKKMRMDQKQRALATKNLEVAQDGMTDDNGNLEKYQGLKTRGQSLLQHGEREVSHAAQQNREAAEMGPEVKRAQKAAAKYEARAQARRNAVTKVQSQIAQLKHAQARLQKQSKTDTKKLASIANRSAFLKRRMHMLESKYHSIRDDIRAREGTRAKLTAHVAATNAKELKNLLSDE